MPEALRGDLSFVRLSSLLQLAEAEGANGVLRLGSDGEIRFSRGEIVAATAGPLAGYSAVRTLFFVSSGPFVLEMSQVDPNSERVPTLVPVTRAVLDGVRLLDEWARIGPMVLAAQGTLPPVQPPADGIVAALDGKTPLQSLILKVKASPGLVVDPLLDLIEGGALQEVAPPVDLIPWPGVAALMDATPVTTPAPTPAAPHSAPGATLTTPSALDYDQLLLDGRRLLREGDFEGAETVFLAAVAVRPDDRIAAQNLRRVRQLREAGDGRGHPWLRTGNSSQ